MASPLWTNASQPDVSTKRCLMQGDTSGVSVGQPKENLFLLLRQAVQVIVNIRSKVRDAQVHGDVEKIRGGVVRAFVGGCDGELYALPFRQINRLEGAENSVLKDGLDGFAHGSNSNPA